MYFEVFNDTYPGVFIDVVQQVSVHVYRMRFSKGVKDECTGMCIGFNWYKYESYCMTKAI